MLAASAAALLAGGITTTVALGDRSDSGARARERADLLDAFEAKPGPLVATDFRFRPARVLVLPGERLEFRNDGETAHTFSAVDGLFSTGVVRAGATASETFDGPREIAVRCEIHPTMQAVIVVPEG